MKNTLCKIKVIQSQINLFMIKNYFQDLKIKMLSKRKFIHLDGKLD